MLEEAEEEDVSPASASPKPSASSPTSPASPPPTPEPQSAQAAAAAVSLLLDRATTLLRNNTPFNVPLRASFSTPNSSSTPESPTSSVPPLSTSTPALIARPILGTRSLTVSSPRDVYNIMFSNDLESLAIDGCELTSLPLQLAACTALRYLRLRENLLDDLPQWLCHLTALHQLDLVGNRLRALPAELAKKLTNLTTLALSENAKFARNTFSFSLPPLANLVRLSDVSLGALNFTTFPLPLLDLPSLRTLNLSDNRITSIPDEISRLSTLHALFLNLNPVAQLPAGFARLTSLLRLHLHRCIFERFPPPLSALQSLETLHIDHNLLSSVPSFISSLSSLSYLSLSNNHISILPDSLLSLTKLRTLLLDHTEVQSLPAIGRLPDVTLISLRQTPFFYVSIELLPVIDKLIWDSKPLYAEPCWHFLPHSLPRLRSLPARVSTLRHLCATKLLRRRKHELPPFMQLETARVCVECRSFFYGEGFCASSLWPFRHFGTQPALSSQLGPHNVPAPTLRFFPVLHVACSPECLTKCINLAAKMIVQFKSQLPEAPAAQTQEQCIIS